MSHYKLIEYKDEKFDVQFERSTIFSDKEDIDVGRLDNAEWEGSRGYVCFEVGPYYVTKDARYVELNLPDILDEEEIKHVRVLGYYVDGSPVCFPITLARCKDDKWVLRVLDLPLEADYFVFRIEHGMEIFLVKLRRG